MQCMKAVCVHVWAVVRRKGGLELRKNNNTQTVWCHSGGRPLWEAAERFSQGKQCREQQIMTAWQCVCLRARPCLMNTDACAWSTQASVSESVGGTGASSWGAGGCWWNRRKRWSRLSSPSVTPHVFPYINLHVRGSSISCTRPLCSPVDPWSICALIKKQGREGDLTQASYLMQLYFSRTMSDIIRILSLKILLILNVMQDVVITVAMLRYMITYNYMIS